MSSVDFQTKAGTCIKWFLLAAIPILAILRFISLGIDPPYFFAGITQAHLTDPYHLTFHARNAVLFGDWNPFGFHRWDVFKDSLVSGTAFLVFSLFGVSRVTANVAGLLLNTLGLLLMYLAVGRHRSLNETLFGAFLALLSASFMFYARLPFLENGLIFWCGLIYFIFARYYNRVWAQLLIGVLIGLAAFSGKLFGFIVIVPVAITYLFIFHKKLYIPLALTVLGTIAGSVIYIAVFYGGDYQTMLSYYHEQTTGMYGTPTGFVSLYGFFMNLITYGGESGFFRLSPYLVSLAGLSSIVFLVSNKEYSKFREENIPVVFMASWLLMGMLMLSPFVYRPLRYTLFLIMPLSAVCAWAVSGALAQKLKISANRMLITIPLGFLIILYLAIQIKMAGATDRESLSAGQSFLFWAIIISAVVTAAIFVMLFKLSDRWKTRILSGAFLALLVATVIFQGHLIYRGLAEPGSYLRDMNREVAEMVGPDAVLTGPYAPAFTIDNKLKAVIYVFGLPDVEQDLFREYPITHVVADVSNWNAALRLFPFLNNSLQVSRFLVRDGTVDIYRVPGDSIPLTDFERCVSDFKAGVYDSVLFYNEKFCKEYPDNLAGQYNLIINYITFGKIDVAVKGLETIANQYPENFQVTAFEYKCYKFLGEHFKNQEYDTLAESFYDRTDKINPTIKLPR